MAKKSEGAGIVPAPTTEIGMVSQQPDSALSIIARAVENPNVSVDVMRGLFELQKDFEKSEAEKSFNRAMARLQPQLPRITKHGKVQFKDTTFAFARYEDIDAAVRPLLSKEGFSISFDQKRVEKETEYRIRLSHVDGHSEERTFILPNDKSGSKNDIQAIGSTASYARRYLISFILNIVTIGEDDDAGSFGYVNDVQAAQLNERIEAEGIDRAKLLASVGADSVEHIQASRFEEVIRKMDERRIKLASKNKVEVV